MSFEFDPLENINRSEDDNDPKTLKALEVREDSVVEPPADPTLEPPIDPRVMPIMVQARTKADP